MRLSKVISISLPPKEARDLDNLAKSEGKTKSEFLRVLLRLYKEWKEEEEFYRVQRYGIKRLRERKLKVTTEEDIDKIVFEGR